MGKKIRCKYRGCLNLIDLSIDNSYYCDKHKDSLKEDYKRYKTLRHDKKEQSFYSSKSWKQVKNIAMQHQLNLCLYCLIKKNKGSHAELVHHIIELKDDKSKALDSSNLICLCDSCHKIIHNKYNRDMNSKIEMQSLLFNILSEFDERYYKKQD